MMDTLKKLYNLRDVSERLKALSLARGVAKNVADKHSEEAQVIKWAYDQLYQLYFAKVMCVVGTSTAIRHLLNEKASIIDERAVGSLTKQHGTLIVFDTNEVKSGEMHNYLVGSWTGDALHESLLPDWLSCDRYFACKLENGSNAVLLHCLVNKSWLQDTGLIEAKAEINDWLINFYSSVRYD